LLQHLDGAVEPPLPRLGALGVRDPAHILLAVGVGDDHHRASALGRLELGFEPLCRHGREDSPAGRDSTRSARHARA